MAKDTLESLRQKAQQALSQGQYQQSCHYFQQALAVGNDHPDLHYGLGTVYFLLGDLPHSVQHFKEVTRLDPLRAGAYVNLGAVYNRLGQYEDAIATLRKGIQLDSNRSEGYYNLGLVYRQLGQLDMAIQAYREATRVNPRMADAHFNIGNIFFEKESYAMAIAHYRQALEIRPNWERAQAALKNVLALQTGETPKAPSAEEPRPPGVLDPDRMIDPNVHGAALRDMHQLIIEMDAHGRKLTDVLTGEVEEAIRGLSNCLLFPDNPNHNLTDQIHKFDLVVGQLQKLQQALQKRMQKAQQTTEHLAKL